MNKITLHLFTKYKASKGFPMFDYDGFGVPTCYFRIHEIHYLVWYENLQHFSIVTNSNAFKSYQEIVIPKPFYDIESVENFIKYSTRIND